jgi:hypothetical protein
MAADIHKLAAFYDIKAKTKSTRSEWVMACSHLLFHNYFNCDGRLV